MKTTTHRSPEGYKATEILAAINKLGVNDDNKSKIVASGALASYVALLNSSCSIDEQFLAAQGLWSLAMKCAKDVRAQENCITGDCVLLMASFVLVFLLLTLTITNAVVNENKISSLIVTLTTLRAIITLQFAHDCNWLISITFCDFCVF